MVQAKVLSRSMEFSHKGHERTYLYKVATVICSYLNYRCGNERMKEVSVRMIFHFALGVILVLVWSYFVSEWWAPVIGVLAVILGLIPFVAGFFEVGEPYRRDS